MWFLQFASLCHIIKSFAMKLLSHLFLSFLAIVLPLDGISARNVRDMIADDVSRVGVNLYTYPVELIAPGTDVPNGYKPFYISHYGRHGSRNDLDKGASWVKLTHRFNQLDSMNVLTDLGRKVKVEIDSLYALQKGKFELLTEVGAEQHGGIARRMAASFPEVFHDGAKVHAIASSSRRCVASMNAFVGALCECNPTLDISSDSGKEVQGICRPGGSKNPMFPRSDYEAFKQYNSSHDNERYQILKRWRVRDDSPAELMVDDCSRSLKAVGTSCSSFGNDVLRALAYGQNMGIDEDELVRSIYTADEIYRFYLGRNYDFLSRYLLIQSPEKARYAYAMKYLMDDVVRKADAVVSGADTQCADLRFGHDTFLLGLLSVLAFDSVPLDFVSVEDFGERVPGFAVIPMAANIQVIFYRNRKNVLVKFLLNENEMTLPIKSFKGPYYRWGDVKKYLERRYEKIRSQAGGRVG